MIQKVITRKCFEMAPIIMGPSAIIINAFDAPFATHTSRQYSQLPPGGGIMGQNNDYIIKRVLFRSSTLAETVLPVFQVQYTGVLPNRDYGSNLCAVEARSSNLSLNLFPARCCGPRGPNSSKRYGGTHLHPPPLTHTHIQSTPFLRRFPRRRTLIRPIKDGQCISPGVPVSVCLLAGWAARAWWTVPNYGLIY